MSARPPKSKTDIKTEPSNHPVPLTEMFKTIGAIVAVPLALFALANNVFSNPAITLFVALITAIIVSVLATRYWGAHILTIVVAWLILVVVALAVIVILPRTITVEGFILDTDRKPISHEKVILVDVNGVSRETDTDDMGHYQFKEVPNDTYVVRVRDIEAGGQAKGPLSLVRILITNLTLPIPTLTPTLMATPTGTPTATLEPTATLTPTQTLTPTPTPHIVVEVGDLSSWTPNYCDDKCSGANGPSSINISLVPGRTNNAIEILYAVRNAGYVVITKNIDPETLSGTRGLSFYYKGSGAPNTIEFKLMLRYPGDTDDTTYGVSWPRASDTGDIWTPKDVLYSHFTCWWPAANCKKHGDRLDLKMVLRMDFGISNKPGDTVGPGRTAFEDVLGILP